MTSQVQSSPFSLDSTIDTSRSLAGSASALRRIDSWTASSADSGDDVSGAQHTCCRDGLEHGQLRHGTSLPQYRS